MIATLAVSGYRSLRDLSVTLAPLTVVSGGNGSGKSSLYRALRLLADAAQGRLIASLAAEGGLASTLWAGPERISSAMRAGTVPIQGTVRSGPVALKLGFTAEDYGYAIELGLPIPSASRFGADPEIKAETVWIGDRPTRSTIIAERHGPAVRARRHGDGTWRDVARDLHSTDSMMTRSADTTDGLELLLLRDRMRGWRFYDHLRTDRDAPTRRPQVGTFTPALADDGSDVAAAIQTIREIGDRDGLAATVNDAFPGARLRIADTWELEMSQHGLLRPLRGAELSEGTLRYLILVAALLTPRPPELIVLNEPEASLHPDLIGPLARLLERAATRTQVLVISHAAALINALDDAGSRHVRLTKVTGETVLDEADRAGWAWAKR